MTNKEFVNKLVDIATNYKTLYVMGSFGAPLTTQNKQRYTQNHSYNKQASRTKMIMNASADTFSFDCVCMIKGILWGWNGNKNHIYGGAEYKSNGVPDIGADSMISKCKNISTDFSKIEIGEAVWCKGHIGVYIGDGLAVECSPAWENKVQITACNCDKAGYNRRNWTKHGFLPYIDYVESIPEKPNNVKKNIDEIVKEVLNGKWGNGQARKDALTKAGYNYNEVQNAVNKALSKKSNYDIAREVIQGKWGNGSTRRTKLTKAGYNYNTIQALVNKILRGE